MTREKLRSDIKTAIVDTWLGTDGGVTLTSEQRTIAEQQIQKLANGIADSVDTYVAEELHRLKEFLVQAGAYTGRTIPSLMDPESQAATTGTLTEQIVSVEPASIKNYTPSSG